NLWTNLGAPPSDLGVAVATNGGAFTLPGLTPTTGTYGTVVFQQADGHLVFAYQVTLATAPPNPANGDVQKLSTGDWADTITVDAKQFDASGSGSVAASGINRLNGVITMYFQDPLVKSGQTSYVLLLYTNATQFTIDTIGIQDGAGTTVGGFVPLAPTSTPEPATLSLLGFGIVGLGALRKKIRK
ncbi:MAG TPA: PEP-CTERM sorting domain-containing protein, partial [Candidatus Acidoferrales bacterium]|nr:PEP-CTERM sorting domain-containing protein [Candidatus Acidoferrales bacterium]